MKNLQYPIGEFVLGKTYTPADVAQCFDTIAGFPARLRATAEQLTAAQWQTPYREGGWTALQVVHHLADSHMNAYIRTKLALTEDLPAVRPYLEDRWATLPDSSLPAEVSLSLLEGIHTRWAVLLKGLGARAFEVKYFHPESQYRFTLAEMMGMYAWHCDHHLAHIKLVL